MKNGIKHFKKDCGYIRPYCHKCIFSTDYTLQCSLNFLLGLSKKLKLEKYTLIVHKKVENSNQQHPNMIRHFKISRISIFCFKHSNP